MTSQSPWALAPRTAFQQFHFFTLWLAGRSEIRVASEPENGGIDTSLWAQQILYCFSLIGRGIDYVGQKIKPVMGIIILHWHGSTF
jgi:hypothetical protein